MNYSNIYVWLKEQVIDAAVSAFGVTRESLDSIAIEVPKEKTHGDLSTNAAMIMAGSLKKNPREIASSLAAELAKLESIEKVDVAGAGFINITFKNSFWQNVLSGIIKDRSDYGKSNIGQGVRVNIEFVSANPTGPLHVGHARGAIYGDALARVMQFAGYDVTKEYYVNDAGSQIVTLVKSAHLRYREVFGEAITIPEGYYPGEYLKTLAVSIKEKHSDKFLKLTEELGNEFRSIVIDEMLELIKDDLAGLRIKHDVFFHESSMHMHLNGGDLIIEETIRNLMEKGLIYEGRNKIGETVAKLIHQKLIYEGKLEAPKGEEDPDWDAREEQLLFRATEFGDVQDRSLTKSDGTWTYFAGDIAYAQSKIDRGFKKNIIVLGADHAGYVKRLQAVYKALSGGNASAEIILTQLVNFVENGQPVKMSKRAGNFTTVADVVQEVGADILRFIMLTRKNDIILDFDLDLVKSQSKENPVFYVQYGCVRAQSVLENAKIHHPDIYKLFAENKYDLAKLTSKPELELIKLLAFWARVVTSASSTCELHKIAYYLQDLASEFHSFWNLGKEFPDYRFIIAENAEISAARLALVKAVADCIKTGLNLIGVKPLEKM